MDVTVSKKKTNKKTKKTRDRRIVKKEDREATFIRKRDELFRKASELSILTGAQLAILIRSPMDNKEIFAFGSPSADAVFERFLAENRPEYFLSDVKPLEGEEGKTEEGREWWDKPTESMDVEQLQQYLQELEKLRADLGSD